MNKNPKIFLLANNWVGLKVTEFLKEKNENIIALGIHAPEKQKLTDKILETMKFPKSVVFQGPELRDATVLKKIKRLDPDIIIAAFWGYILKPSLLELAPMGAINMHPGYLPFNRGMNPNVWPFVEGTQAGATIHYIDNGIDTGDIIAQKQIPLEPIDTAGTLEEKTWSEMVSLFKDNWEIIRSDCVKRIPQDNSIATFHKASDVNRLDEIDLNKEYKGQDLINNLRARSYKDRSYVYYIQNGKKIHIKIELYESEK